MINKLLFSTFENTNKSWLLSPTKLSLTAFLFTHCTDSCVICCESPLLCQKRWPFNFNFLSVRPKSKKASRLREDCCCGWKTCIFNCAISGTIKNHSFPSIIPSRGISMYSRKGFKLDSNIMWKKIIFSYEIHFVISRPFNCRIKKIM